MKVKKIKENLSLAYVGVQPNSKGFLLSFEEAEKLIKKNPKNKECLKIFMIGRDLNQGWTWSGSRMIIDFQNWPLEKAMEYKECFEIVENKVFQHVKNLKSNTQDKLRWKKHWWNFYRSQMKMRQQLKPLKKFIATARASKYRLFVMIENQNILPDCTTVIIASSNFSFMGILSSKMHIVWAKHNGSTLGNGSRYTNTTCFETFPFPFEEKAMEKLC